MTGYLIKVVHPLGYLVIGMVLLTFGSMLVGAIGVEKYRFSNKPIPKYIDISTVLSIVGVIGLAAMLIMAIIHRS